MKAALFLSAISVPLCDSLFSVLALLAVNVGAFAAAIAYLTVTCRNIERTPRQ